MRTASPYSRFIKLWCEIHRRATSASVRLCFLATYSILARARKYGSFQYLERYDWDVEYMFNQQFTVGDGTVRGTYSALARVGIEARASFILVLDRAVPPGEEPATNYRISELRGQHAKRGGVGQMHGRGLNS